MKTVRGAINLQVDSSFKIKQTLERTSNTFSYGK